jgi:hypothetical protein
MVMLILLCALPAGCRKKSEVGKSAPPTAQPAAAPDTIAKAAGPAAPETEGAPEWIRNPQVTPGTTVLSAVDPHDMTPTERQFGRAPKRSPDVDYKPGVIVMEEGDKAIKSVATNGLTWTFDANAPHVNEFQEGKIVFATGRAVGKVTALRRSGNTVSLVLGPVQLTDLIQRGRFVMDQPIDPDKILSYIAPDYPGANDSAGTTNTSMLDGARDGEETVVVSTPSHGKWIPTSMSQTFGDGRRMTYRRRGGRWIDANRAMANPRRASVREGVALATRVHETQGIPGMPQGAPHVPALRPLNITPAQSVNIDNGNVRVDGVANKTFLGVQYYYHNKQSGLGASASGLITLQAPVVRCVLKFANGDIDSAGIEIKGAGGVKLRLDANSPTEAFANMHLKKWVPLDMSIQLGGPVPFSLTFAVLFDINSGFSAKSSKMVAEGEYGFSGGIWAGRAGGHWAVGSPTNITPITNLGRSIAGISLGINSFALSFGIRTTVGVGAFGFNAGVFAQVRFGGSLLLAPNEAVQCRQATIETFLDSGVGYQTPKWASDAINFFLGAIGAHAIDPVGTLVSAPSQSLFKGFDQIPTGCSGKSG